MAGLEWRVMTKALREAAAEVPVLKKTKWPLQLAALSLPVAAACGELFHNGRLLLTEYNNVLQDVRG